VKFELLFFRVTNITTITIMMTTTPPTTPPTIAPTGVPGPCFVSVVLAVVDEVPVGTNSSLNNESTQITGYGETFVRSATAEG
jgi:hypothetical protein